MTVKRLFAIVFILVCTAFGWIVLGTSLTLRTATSSGALRGAVSDLWGPPMTQPHPEVSYASPSSPGGRKRLPPERSDVDVRIRYEPKRKGLSWHRTYQADFRGSYLITNPTPITQTFYVRFQFPAEAASYTDFSFALNGVASTANPNVAEGLTEAVTLAPGGSAPLEVTYRTRGTDHWIYSFGDTSRVRNFRLTMHTDFTEIDFPVGTSSADSPRPREDGGYRLSWEYPDRIGAQAIGMAMPNVLNPGPVAARITFFAPVSLLFFFSVLLLTATVRGVSLHPMHFFFLAAGFFAFHLLFAYTVDLLPLHFAFALSAAISIALVSGYLSAVAGPSFGRIAATAQLAYMVLFSYSFFFDGLTGITITVGAIITLALLMFTTARVDWAAKFTAPPRPVAAS